MKYLTAVKSICSASGLDMLKLVGIGSDGASVVTSKESGVVARLRHEFSPHLLDIHIAHRLTLTYSDATKDVRYLSDFSGDKSLKLKSNFEIRWLSLNNAVQFKQFTKHSYQLFELF